MNTAKVIHNLLLLMMTVIYASIFVKVAKWVVKLGIPGVELLLIIIRIEDYWFCCLLL